MDKNLIRSNIINKRNSLDKETISKKSNIIAHKLLKLKEYEKTNIILCYANVSSEVETLSIFKDALKEEKIVAYPKVVSTKQMDFYVIKSYSELQPGYKGILEPITKVKLDATQIKEALLITPGSVFNKNGYRMGYGKGYYDRFIAKYKPNLKIGLAFELQISDDIIVEDHDQKLDIIITEDNIYK